MKIAAFRIKSFRSIVDSQWVSMSPDGITALVGQNESGKTSVLDALGFALSEKQPTEDDFRIGEPLPSVALRVDIDRKSVAEAVKACSAEERQALDSFVDAKHAVVELAIGWGREAVDGKPTIVRSVAIVGEELEASLVQARESVAARQAQEAEARKLASALAAAQAAPPEMTVPAAVPAPSIPNAAPAPGVILASVSTLITAPITSPVPAPTPATALATTAAATTGDEEPAFETFDANHFARLIYDRLPAGVLFNEATGSLPSHVDIEKGKPVGPGAQAAMNFLSIAGINLPELVASDLRGRNNVLNKANDLISTDFNVFWTQTIGETGRLSLKCEMGNYDASDAEKAGKPRLVFWIIDGNTQLYPKQRSQGVRWFISFYLQLKASEKSGSRRVFLLDEPGANLHAKAQSDVLKLINKLGKQTSTVVYSTHSPQLIEYDKLFRVHAVQRDSDQDDSPTEVIDAHRLGAASSDTLSPVLAAMGVDLSNNQVIRKENNVLLEEMSGYYYLSRFWKLTGQAKEAHFIAATGVNKIEALANMFIGWGLAFIVAVDDDKQGREAYKSMKRELFGDVEEVASKRLLKIPSGPSIEDILSVADFKDFVLGNASLSYASSNADYVKSQGRSKPVLAFKFALRIDSGELTWESFDDDSKQRITAVMEALASRLGP